ncbi:integrase arm-type DNA-binding domain-containing protein [Rhizobium sp. 18065]|uniref:tyrosine-type recombinase/integrase n=1 Tax=Rhizobium sp. 18065 TaxID=2681411 RepID=UPI00135B69ED|nr:integrase arm-type DNA-binding domain-containing protein [Rhizobium sp. 18065]
MLTDAKVKNAKAAGKPYKLTDSGGLHVYVSTTGSRLWRWRYLFRDKEKLLSLGTYPDMSLSDARKARDKARDDLKAGRDPSAVKKIERLSPAMADAESFEAVAREWFELQKPQWVERHALDVIESLEKEIFPYLGSFLVKDIGPSDILPVLRVVEKRGAAETARRIRQRMSSVFVYAIASGRAGADPAAVIQKAMAPIKKGKQPAIIDLGDARAMLRATETTPAHPATKLALRILALTSVRPGSLVSTPWSEWDAQAMEEALWQIPAARLKLKLKHKEDEARDHIVPLARQTIEAIEALRQLTGRGILAFPNGRHSHKQMSENAIGYLLNRSGYHSKHVPHGWRATFSSVMNERFKSDKAVIDLMLAHVPKDKVEGAYNRALHLDRRAELAQLWADLILDGAPPAADLLVGPRKILKTQ